MKRIFIVFALGLGLVACNDNTNTGTGTGGSIDSNYAAPDAGSSTDQTTSQPDTSLMDTNNGAQRNAHGDTNMRKDNPEGTSSGQSGSSTNSNNSGSATDDTKGNK